jgi:hypothetical protein
LTGIVRVDLSEFELDLAVDVHIREQDEAAAQRSRIGGPAPMPPLLGSGPCGPLRHAGEAHGPLLLRRSVGVGRAFA